MLKKAIFLDKDGTLIVDKPYNVNPELLIMEDGVIEGLLMMQDLGYELIVISNQPGIAMGLFTLESLEDLIKYFKNLLAGYGIRLNDFFFCPHLPPVDFEESTACDCRKPKPGLIVRAALLHEIDLSKSWMIGDILNDVEAGNLAGCRSVLIDNGNETEWIKSEYRNPTFVASNFFDAAKFICKQI